MTRAYQYSFARDIPTESVEATLLLAVVAAESLHGESDVRLDAGHTFDPVTSRCVIEANTTVGRDLCRLFTGFLRREFGDYAFRVEPTNLDGAARRDEAVSAV
jgi:hypothetical protein